MGFNTELLHGTKTGDPVTGATLTPVYQSSAFFQPSAEQHEKLFHNKAAGYSYTRINNPTIAGRGEVSDAAGSGGRGEAAMERKKTASGMENFVF